jgi:radical SAM protein (TIGR04043 family)
MDLKKIHIELQSYGVRLPAGYPGRKGGAGPAEGAVIILNDHYLSVPTQSAYVAYSPYTIAASNGSLVLCKNKQEIAHLCFPPQPNYYDLKTADGIAFDKLALMHGKDCLASTVYQHCKYWNTNAVCSFCGIALSLFSNSTPLFKDPEALGLVANQALVLDGARHVTLTTGMQETEQATIGHLCRCVASIKTTSNLPVHVQICPPEHSDSFELLKSAGVDTIGIHIESFALDTLKRVAPSKACRGLKPYINAWEDAVTLFGKNQVSSFIIAGLGEDPSSVLSGAQMLCELGVYPYLLPLRPIPGTLLEHTRPPDPETMMCLYESIAALLRKHGLSSKLSTAGCVRCGACSSISLFE